MHPLTFLKKQSVCYVNMHCFCCNNKVCRQLDDFAIRVSKQTRNTNSEISEHDGFKLFPHGFADYIRNENRVDGGWHLSMTRHLHVWFCTSIFLSNDKKLLCASACCKLYEVNAFLRWPVKRAKLAYFSVLIDDLLQILVEISIPYVACQGNSIKFYWPRHWVYSRLQLGCAAAEKTLERKLAETQKSFSVLLMGKAILVLKLLQKTCGRGRYATYYMRAVFLQWQTIMPRMICFVHFS